MLTPREAFQVGFLMECADRGLDGPAVRACVGRAAGLLKEAGYFTDQALQALGRAQGIGSAAAVAVPLAAGVGGAYLAHRLVDPDLDAEELRRRELLHELRHWTRRVREQPRRRPALA